jgi:hypothetical protein
MSITIGNVAIDRGNWTSIAGYTHIDRNVAANESGSLDTFQVYFHAWNASGVKIGTFSGAFWSDPNILHDYVTIGAVTCNQVSTFTGLNCAVSAGEYLGIYATDGMLECNTLYGYYTKRSPNDEFANNVKQFNVADSNKFSLYGVGGSIPIPDSPTNFAATKNQSDKVTMTWIKSTGATGYKIYKNSTLFQTVGDVNTYDDTAAAPVITAGTANATDGSLKASVTLTLSGHSIANGTTATYYVTATNISGESSSSGTDTGYRLASALTLQWQRSSADLSGSFTDISGATTSSFDDTGAPSDGSIRQFRCVVSAVNSVSQYSSVDSGCRAAMSGGVSRARLTNGA